IAIGRSGFKLMAVASTWNSELESWNSDEIRAELYISRHSDPGECKHYFNLLQRQQTIIEAELGESLSWDSQPDRKACRIYLRKSVELQNRADWPAQHQWLTEKLDRMHRVFSPRIKQLTLAEVELDS
ncbi:MAG: DUF4268 domain-containing protein, partial [Cyanobacteria bacterium P01_A01_bin.135]